MKNKKTANATVAAAIAALYVVLTYVSFSFGLSSSVVQCRISEGLCVLAAYTPAAIPGLVIGCLISNTITNAHFLDIIMGTLATFAGTYAAFLMRKRKYTAPLPYLAVNTLAIPPMLIYLYNAQEAGWIVYLTFFAGEAVACLGMGYMLVAFLERTKSGKTLKNILENI